MSAPTLDRQQPSTQVEQAARIKPKRRITGPGLLHAWTWLVIAWLILPIVVMIAFGFNDTPGRYNQTWVGFTFKWYGRLFEYSDLTSALITSILIAIVASLLSGALSTLR